MNQFNVIKDEALAKLNAALTLAELEEIRQVYLAKKGILTGLMAQLKDLDPMAKKDFGQGVNALKNELEVAFNDKLSRLEADELSKKLAAETIDITLPGRTFKTAPQHPFHLIKDEITEIFLGMGYKVAEGFEVEEDYFNFTLLNMPENHPARDMQDSFYINKNTLLRTHTSPVQARTMLKKNGAPLRIICPGKVYRRDDDDPTHSHQFMQIEGLVIDTNITFANLKDALLTMVKHLFGNERIIRLRPSYFPFTEPSVEVDVSYQKKDGSIGWIEVLGAGQVHPNVLKMGGYDPKKFQGFAFGIGVERIAILKYAIDDIRHFYTNDLRFLSQFKGVNR